MESNYTLRLNDEGNAYILEGIKYNRVSEILKVAGHIDDRWFSEFHAVRGTYVHQACTLFDNGQLDESNLDPQLVPFVEGYKKFISEVKMHIIWNEMPVYNKPLRYAGTLDKIVYHKSRFGVLDIKCSKALPKHVGQQTMAYLLAWNHMIFPYKPEHVVKDRYCLLLPGDGSYVLRPLINLLDSTEWYKSLQKFKEISNANFN